MPPPLLEVYRELEAMHAWRGWHWWAEADPFEIIVGAILVQNTNWANVERALENLRAENLIDPGRLTALGPEDLEALIRPSGQYRQKARKVRALLDLVERSGGLEALLNRDAAELRGLLLGTWGIGPETADAILVFAAHHVAFVIDAYTQRLFTRLGYGPGVVAGPGASYETWQRWFTDRLPPDRDLYARYHSVIVLHCKHLCLKLQPRCGDCALKQQCAYAVGAARDG